MTTLRCFLLVAAATILPSCGRDHEKWLWVTVRNDGAVSADVWSKTENTHGTGDWDEEVNVSVAANQSIKFGFRYTYVDRLKVRVCRSSDQAIVFNETWDRHELDDLNREVQITVTP